MIRKNYFEKEEAKIRQTIEERFYFKKTNFDKIVKLKKKAKSMKYYKNKDKSMILKVRVTDLLDVDENQIDSVEKAIRNTTNYNFPMLLLQAKLAKNFFKVSILNFKKKFEKIAKAISISN